MMERRILGFNSLEGFYRLLYGAKMTTRSHELQLGHTEALMNEIDTVVVPAREGGFTQVFLGENMWRSIRIHFSMLTKIRHIALYQVAPVSAITHVAEVARIELWKDTQKYALFFKGPAHKITPIPFVPHGRVNALQNIRYTSLARITQAKNLDDLF